MKWMMLYFGLGFEANICKAFAECRDKMCCRNRNVNKLCYGVLGVCEVCTSCAKKKQNATFFVHHDGKPVQIDLPEDCKSIITKVVPSLGGGKKYLPTYPGKFTIGTSTCPFTTGLHGAGITEWWNSLKGYFTDSKPWRSHAELHSGSQMTVKFHKTTTVQIDGEAWDQQPGILTIKRHDFQPILLGPTVYREFESLAVSPSEWQRKQHYGLIGLMHDMPWEEFFDQYGLPQDRLRKFPGVFAKADLKPSNFVRKLHLSLPDNRAADVKQLVHTFNVKDNSLGDPDSSKQKMPKHLAELLLDAFVKHTGGRRRLGDSRSHSVQASTALELAAILLLIVPSLFLFYYLLNPSAPRVKEMHAAL